MADLNFVGISGAIPGSSPVTGVGPVGGPVNLTPASSSPLGVGTFIDNALSTMNSFNPVVAASDAATSAVKAKVAGASSWITDLFLRGVVIILGFIFIAVGLTMFKNGSINIFNTTSHARRGAGMVKKIVETAPEVVV